jgi:hypothetical protein
MRWRSKPLPSRCPAQPFWKFATEPLVAQQGRHTCFGIPRLPAPYCRTTYPGLAGHLGDGQSLARQQHDPGALDVLLRAVPVHRNRSQLLLVGIVNDDANCLGHPANLAEPFDLVNRSSASVH